MPDESNGSEIINKEWIKMIIHQMSLIPFDKVDEPDKQAEIFALMYKRLAAGENINKIAIELEGEQ